MEELNNYNTRFYNKTSFICCGFQSPCSLLCLSPALRHLQLCPPPVRRQDNVHTTTMEKTPYLNKGTQHQHTNNSETSALPSWVRPYQPHHITSLSTDQKMSLERAKAYARSYTLNPTPSTHIVEYGHNSSKSMLSIGRLYVGGISLEVPQDEVKSLFTPYGPLHAVSFTTDHHTGKHKGFAFVEYEVPEASSLAIIHTSGLELSGKPIKVGRPNNFSTTLYDSFPKAVGERLYVCNVNENITEEELSSIFAPFGSPPTVRLTPNVLTRKHKGWGYIEFSSTPEAELAFEAMNGFELGGKIMRLAKSEVGGPLPPGMSVLEQLEKTRERSPRRRSPRRRSPPPPRRRSPPPPRRTSPPRRHSQEKGLETSGDKFEKTTILLLENMILADELDDELEADIQSECSRYGTILSAKFHTVGSSVRVFVEYESLEGSEKAFQVMDGRWFSKRQILARFYSQDAFREGTFDL
jgi:poly(U)-binding-splicing factor PUF60